MNRVLARITLQGRYLDPDTRCWSRQLADNRNDEIDDFWPEVSTRYSLEDSTPVNPANTQGRVLLEIGLVLGAVGALVAAVYILLPGATFP
jgi:hypothetical protein